MLLAIDIGNTNITLGVFENESILETFRLPSDKELPQKEYEILLHTLFKKYDIVPTNLNKVFDIEQQNICPFRDIDNKKCKIYKVRPSICQSFNCNSDYSSIMNYKGVKAINMLHTFYPHEYTNKMPDLEPINKRLKEERH